MSSAELRVLSAETGTEEFLDFPTRYSALSTQHFRREHG